MALSYVTLSDIKARLGIQNTTDDTVLGSIIGQVNAFIESYTHRQIGDIEDGQATYTLHYENDDAHDNGRVFTFQPGISDISILEVAPYTGADYVTVPASDYFLMPSAKDRDTGWPAFEIHMTDIPTAGNTQPFFAPGYNTVRITGRFGWVAIPAEVSEVATNLALALWRSRSAGTSDVFTIGPDGERTFERALSDKDRRTLNRYQTRAVTIV